jgi:hypothetical protein
MIAAWGAYAGDDDDLPPPDELNPRGRREYQPLWELLENIGDFADGASWWEESFPGRVAAKLTDVRVLSSARDLVAQMERHGLPWVWKDPALCHFLPFWREVWHHPLYVVAVRNPLDVARSWQQFAVLNGQRPTSVTCNLLRWQHMLVSVLQETGEASDRIFVDYDTLVEDPLGQARRLAEVLDQYCGRTSDAARIAAMAATCDPALRRIRSAPASARREVAPAQAALYRLLRQRAADIGVSSGTYPMPDDWRALVITEEAATRT